LVAAARGRRGGYELALPPDRINVAQVLQALGVPAVTRQSCDGGQRAAQPCPRLGDCGLRSVWRHLEERVTHVLERVYVVDLLRAEHGMSAHLAALWPQPDATSGNPGQGIALEELTVHE
jgi:DNA-binding IscR family transcriptional regulator